MVAPRFLENPEVRRWLNGVEPAWTMLEFNSLNALRHEPSASNHAIRLEPDLADAEISGSAVTANALILLRSFREIRRSDRGARHSPLARDKCAADMGRSGQGRKARPRLPDSF